MALSAARAIEQTKIMLAYRRAEEDRLDKIHAYLRGRQRFLWLPSAPTVEIKRFAEMSRINVLALVVEVISQALYVDGYRAPKEAADAGAWEIWQANGMDARQCGIHRAAAAYGASFATVLPGDPLPVIRGVSPRNMTVVYGEDDVWPVWALEKRRSAVKGRLWRLFDEDASYWIGEESADELTFISSEIHEAGVCPVVRYLNTQDLDDEVIGEVEPVMPIQDQINLTTFSLLVAQHFGAFRQRYIMGWVAEDEATTLKASAQKLWTFEDPDVQVGEFGQTDLKGYIDSREASLRHLATMTQTPAHELLGQLVNLSAEALAAAEASHRRKIAERMTSFGEAHEQTLALAATIAGLEAEAAAEVRWRDTEARSMAQMVDALGKLATMLGVPVQELWERVPGVTQQDVERWKAAAEQGDAFAQLEQVLTRQATGMVAAGNGGTPAATATV